MVRDNLMHNINNDNISSPKGRDVFIWAHYYSTIPTYEIIL